MVELHQEQEEEAEDSCSSHAALEHRCCGRAPLECFSPSYVAHRMGDYYPRIEYFVASESDPAHTLTKLRNEEGQVLHPTPSAAA